MESGNILAGLSPSSYLTEKYEGICYFICSVWWTPIKQQGTLRGTWKIKIR